MPINDKINIRISGDAGEVQAAFNALGASMDQLNSKLGLIAKGAETGGQSIGQMANRGIADVGRFIGQITGLGGVLAALHTTAQLVRAEYETFQKARQGPAERQASLAGAEQKMIMALGKDPMSPMELSKRVKDMARVFAGGDLLGTMNSAASLLSNRGGMTAEQALSALRVSTDLFAELPTEDREANAGALSVIMQKQGLTAEEAQGLLIGAMKPSAIKDLEKFGQFAVPSAIQTATDYEDVRARMAFTAALTQEAVDPNGRMSGTASIRLFEKFRKTTEPTLGPGASFREQLALIQSNPALQAELLGWAAKDLQIDAQGEGTLGGEAKVRSGMEKLIKGEAKFMAEFERIIAEDIPSRANAPKLVEEYRTQVGALPMQQAARARRMGAAAEAAVLEDSPSLAVEGQLLDFGEKLRAALDQPGTADSIRDTMVGWFRAAQVASGGVPGAVAGFREELEDARSEVLTRGRTGRGRELTREAQEQVNSLNALIETLNAVAPILENTNQSQAEQQARMVELSTRMLQVLEKLAAQGERPLPPAPPVVPPKPPVE